jgi:hypothetical protein
VAVNDRTARAIGLNLKRVIEAGAIKVRP